MSDYELIEEELPPRTRSGGGNRVDTAGIVRQLRAKPGAWFRIPREYSGYPTEMKKRFLAAGCEAQTRPVRNDDGVPVGHMLYVRYPESPNGESVTGEG